MSDARTKRHILIFETSSGKLTVATDDLLDVSEQAWFSSFLNVAELKSARYAQPSPRQQAYEQPQQQVPVQQMMPAQPVPQVPPARQVPVQPVQQQQMNFMNINPNEMTDAVWLQLSPQQQNEYIKHYGL